MPPSAERISDRPTISFSLPEAEPYHCIAAWTPRSTTGLAPLKGAEEKFPRSWGVTRRLALPRLLFQVAFSDKRDRDDRQGFLNTFKVACRGLFPHTQTMLNRPPPYFPQNQLSPPDEKRYKKFKLVIAGAIVGGLALLTAIGFGIYFLIGWLF